MEKRRNATDISQTPLLSSDFLRFSARIGTSPLPGASIGLSPARAAENGRAASSSTTRQPAALSKRSSSHRAGVHVAVISAPFASRPTIASPASASATTTTVIASTAG